jgi:hypothetical protein
MGAMYFRQILWKMYETVGDGTATGTHAKTDEGVRSGTTKRGENVTLGVIDRAARTVAI